MEGGRIAVSFAVTDTGIGMTEDVSSRVFDLFTRAEAVQRAGIEGVGLGLAISRQLTEAMGGNLSVESVPHMGSRFVLTVPLGPGDAAQVEAPDIEPQGHADLDVLVIDDNAVNRIVARGYLERVGARVTEAADGAAGLAALDAARPDLVLLDLDLPDMPGAEVARRIAARPDAPCVAALTAHSLDDTPNERARLGVARILVKPVSPRALAALLEGLAGAVTDPDAEAVRQGIAEDVADLGPETTAQVVAEFLTDLPAAMQTIGTAAPSARARHAHRLKGAASNFRLSRLCALLARIEVEPGALPPGLLPETKAAAEAADRALRDAAARAGLQTVAGSTKR